MYCMLKCAVINQIWYVKNRSAPIPIVVVETSAFADAVVAPRLFYASPGYNMHTVQGNNDHVCSVTEVKMNGRS